MFAADSTSTAAAVKPTHLRRRLQGVEHLPEVDPIVGLSTLWLGEWEPLCSGVQPKKMDASIRLLTSDRSTSYQRFIQHRLLFPRTAWDTCRNCCYGRRTDGAVVDLEVTPGAGPDAGFGGSPCAVLASSSQAPGELEAVDIPFDINAAVQSDVYLLGPGDVLELKLFDAPELSGTLEVLNDGSVALPLVGSVGVSGLTLQQASDGIQRLRAASCCGLNCSCG